jgi:SAM-dependent methyltransferase/methyltransferase-like protein
MSQDTVTSYDEIPYSNLPFAYTHPDCLATVATLLGMAPAPVTRCRVLELGCGRGGNLMPMAQALPDSRFVGIDLSRAQIAEARETARALGLANLELAPLSILDVGADFGTFDYIICHGVYSWVPEEVSDRILTVCARHLAADGVAYVSYNTYPGWHFRGMIRDMMRFHVGQFDEPRERIEQARAMLEFLVRAVANPDSFYGGLLQIEVEMLEKSPDTYVFHEHLEDVNHPLYFHEFAGRAAAKGLQYLAEARPLALPRKLSPDTVQTLERVSTDLIRGEQYLDFLRCQTFRRTLLCHARVPLRRPPPAERLTAMHLTSLVKPVAAQPDIHSTAVEEFRTAEGTQLTTNNPVVKAALVILFEVWPRSVPFGGLWAAVCDRLAAAAPTDPGPLAEALLQCYLSGLVELHVYPPGFAAQPGACPVASPLARLQAGGSEPIANLRHHVVGLEGLDRILLPYLDGSRDREALLGALTEAVLSGELDMRQGDKPLRDRDAIRELLAGSLEDCLQRLAKGALLVA